MSRDQCESGPSAGCVEYTARHMVYTTLWTPDKAGLWTWVLWIHAFNSLAFVSEVPWRPGKNVSYLASLSNQTKEVS